MLTAFQVISTQITRVVFFYGSESWYRPRRDRKLRFSKKKKRTSMYDFEILVDHQNLVTISCFRTFLIFIQSYIFIFAFILNTFFFTCFCPFFLLQISIKTYILQRKTLATKISIMMQIKSTRVLTLST